MKERITVSVSTGTIIRTVVILILFAGLFYISDFIVALLVSVVLASSLELPVSALAKRGVPRAVSVSLIFLLLISILATIVLVFIPPLADDIALFVKNLPKVLDSVRIFGRDMGFKDMALYVQSLSRDISKGQILTILKTAFLGSGSFFATTSVVVSSVVNFVITFVLAFYLALEEHGVQKFLRLIVARHQEEYISDLWARAQKKIGLWMQGQLILSLVVSLLVYVPLLVLDMPYATLLAILAFFGELVPVVGLTVATIPALLLAWTHGGVSLLGIVALVYFVVGQLESNILYPKIMNKMVGVPSVIIIIALIVGGKFAGLWGVLLAVPLASILMELADDINKRKGHVS